MTTPEQRNDLDTRIWEEELQDFVPQRIFDIHTHLYRWSDYHHPDKDRSPYYATFGKTYPTAGWEQLAQADRLMMPGRSVDRLSFGFPFPEPYDFDSVNRFTAEQVHDHPESAALMLVKPDFNEAYIDDMLLQGRFMGFKPYRLYSSTRNTEDCRITDFMPIHQIELADRHGLIIMMHLAKRSGVCDEDNLRDLSDLCSKYPNVKWVLAHCARSYADWPIRRAAGSIRDLPNVWYDTSSVCDPGSIAALIETVGPERVMYGSDDLPVGITRGKYIAFAHGWAFVSAHNRTFDVSHCDGRMTFVRYEQLRAMKQACTWHKLTQIQIEAMFFGTASDLIDSVRRSN